MPVLPRIGCSVRSWSREDLAVVGPPGISTDFYRYSQHLQDFLGSFHRESLSPARSSDTLPCNRIYVMAKTKGPAQVYQFPLPLEGGTSEAAENPSGAPNPVPANRRDTAGLGIDVVISGTYRKDNEELRKTYEEFRDLGCRIISPISVRIASESQGFVFMEGEQSEPAENIELRHLNAIQQAQFMWLHAPEGYVGLSGALEVGFARAVGVPIFTSVECLTLSCPRSFFTLNHRAPWSRRFLRGEM
jgi:hypothetical protein